MIEYNPEKLTEQDLLDAANKIFTVQEKGFHKIQSEKWYQTLLHAITFNQDGVKYAIKGIRSLAKLQQLFMEIYVKNYRETNKQLGEIIDAVIKNSEGIKKLYGMCILRLEEQPSLSLLDKNDAEILALFLGEYRNSDGIIPEKVQMYNRGVLKAINQLVPVGALDNHQISKLKNPKVVFRCFMEQCAVDGTIDTQEWTDEVFEDLKDFELSENTKNLIRDSVKKETEIAGIEYLIDKYSRDNSGIMLTDLFIDPAELSGQNVEKPATRPDIHESRAVEDMTDEFISTIITIKKGESKQYKYKNLHMASFINCEGDLLIDHCVVYYNETEVGDEITLGNGANLTITNSDIVCKGYDETPFITCNGSNNVTIEKTTFLNCSCFLHSSWFSDEGINLFLTECRLENCAERFVNVSVGEQFRCKISHNAIILDQIAEFNMPKDYLYGSLISISSYDHDNEDGRVEFYDNVVEESDSYNDKMKEYGGFRCLSAATAYVHNCTFTGLASSIRANRFIECKFKRCFHAVTVEPITMSDTSSDCGMVEDCVFEDCEDVLRVGEFTKISNCQFVSCKDGIIWPIADVCAGGIEIEFCEFINCVADKRSCIVLWKSNSKIAKSSIVKKCVFDGIELIEGMVIEPDLPIPQKPSGTVVSIEDCDFRNCSTKRSDGKIIEECIEYEPLSLFGKKQIIHAVKLSGCKGLDSIGNSREYFASAQIKSVTKMGTAIGSAVAITAVGNIAGGILGKVHPVIGGVTAIVAEAAKRGKDKKE